MPKVPSREAAQRVYSYLPNGYVQYKNYCKECNNKRTQEWRARKKMATEN